MEKDQAQEFFLRKMGETRDQYREVLEDAQRNLAAAEARLASEDLCRLAVEALTAIPMDQGFTVHLTPDGTVMIGFDPGPEQSDDRIRFMFQKDGRGRLHPQTSRVCRRMTIFPS